MPSQNFSIPDFSSHDHPFLKSLSSPYGYPSFSHQALHFGAGALAAAAKLPVDFLTHVRFERLILSYPSLPGLFGPQLRGQEKDAASKKRKKKPASLGWLNKNPAAAANLPYLEPLEPLSRLSLRWWRIFFNSTVKGSLIFGSALALQDVFFTGMTEAGAGREQDSFEWSRLMGWRFRE